MSFIKNRGNSALKARDKNLALEKKPLENHGLLFGIDIVPYPINQPLKLCLIQILMDETYTMVQYVGLNVVQ
jgi:hypothetical protein